MTPEEKYNMGKGSQRRPGDRDAFRDGYDRIWSDAPPTEEEHELFLALRRMEDGKEPIEVNLEDL